MAFRNKLLKERNQNLRTESNKISDKKTNCTNRAAKDVLGERKKYKHKETQAVKTKMICFKQFQK